MCEENKDDFMNIESCFMGVLHVVHTFKIMMIQMTRSYEKSSCAIEMPLPSTMDMLNKISSNLPPKFEVNSRNMALQ